MLWSGPVSRILPGLFVYIVSGPLGGGARSRHLQQRFGWWR
jgi:hypothetical protein